MLLTKLFLELVYHCQQNNCHDHCPGDRDTEDTRGSLSESPPPRDCHDLTRDPPQFCHAGCPAHRVSRGSPSSEFCCSHGDPARTGHIVTREKFVIQI